MLITLSTYILLTIKNLKYFDKKKAHKPFDKETLKPFTRLVCPYRNTTTIVGPQFTLEFTIVQMVTGTKAGNGVIICTCTVAAEGT